MRDMLRLDNSRTDGSTKRLYPAVIRRIVQVGDVYIEAIRHTGRITGFAAN